MWVWQVARSCVYGRWLCTVMPTISVWLQELVAARRCPSETFQSWLSGPLATVSVLV